MADDRSAEMLSLVQAAADGYFAKHGRYPRRLRLGPTVSRYLLVPGVQEGRIQLRPSDPQTTASVSVFADNTLSPMSIVVES
jgi:hypothetical protein